MPDPEDILADSPADFDSSFAYALHGEMRRLIIVTIVGALLFPVGMATFFDPSFFTQSGEAVVRQVIGLVAALAGAGLLFGGLVGTLFKLVTDANIVARTATEE